MNTEMATYIGVLILIIIALIPLWNLVSNHFEKRFGLQRENIERDYEAKIKQIEVTQQLTTQMQLLSKDISAMNKTMEDIQVDSGELFDRVEVLEGVVFKKHRVN